MGVQKKDKKRLRKRLHNGKPQMEQIVTRSKKNGKVIDIPMSRVKLNRRMCRDNEPLATLTAKHELREVLLAQHGWRKTRSHAHAVKREKSDRKRLGFSKSYGWLAREFWKPQSRSYVDKIKNLGG